MSKFEIYCVTDKPIKLIKNKNYNLCAAKNGIFPNSYLIPNIGDNIENKENIILNLHFIIGFGKISFKLILIIGLDFVKKKILD